MRLVLFGSGGHARVALDAARVSAAYEVVAVIDDDPVKKGSSFEGLLVRGDRSLLPSLRAEGVMGALLGIGSVDVGDVRATIFRLLRDAGFRLPVIVHPRATVAGSAVIGDGSVVFAGAIINPGALIGVNVIVNTGAIVEHDVVVGDHTHISPGAHVAGGVRIGAGSHIGIGSTVIQGVTIGEHAFVAAGALVTKNVADGGRVRGVPARPFE